MLSIARWVNQSIHRQIKNPVKRKNKEMEESELIGIKNSIYPLQQGLSELENRIKELEKDGDYSLNDATVQDWIKSLNRLEERIKILEEARQRQISLNSTFQTKESKEIKFSVLDFFRKK